MTSLLRKHTADRYRKIRKILHQGRSEPLNLPPTLLEDKRNLFSAGSFGICCLLAFFMLAVGGCSQHGYAETIEGHDIKVWASAIYKAENSHAHPYGIMTHYRHTSPRQACINTVRHQYRIWCKNACNMPFLAFLASKYAPIRANNDPTGLNFNWTRNVGYFLQRANA